MVNAIEHGNRFCPEKKVHVEVSLCTDYVLASVIDEGEGFNWEEKLNSDKDIICERERGRGLILANMFSKKVFYNEKGNKAFIILMENKS